MKTILQLCADTGSDTKPYSDAGYNVILVGSDIGVENYHPPQDVYGIIANPVCLEFSTARSGGKARNPDEGMELVKECQRIIAECNPVFWVIENPATGALRNYLGKPQLVYQPWEYGSPWTKKTALWGNFNVPQKVYTKWDDVPKIPELYTRPGRGKPSLVALHKASYRLIPEFQSLPEPESDMEFRSMCSQKFARAFFEANK
jgi:hypothetical protein